MTPRRSVSPKRLGLPGPSDHELEAIVGAGLRAPDHGGLVPWRVIGFAPERRARLGDLFAQEKRRRSPLASDDDLARARAHATHAPALLAFVVCIRSGATVPAHEQWLAAGAALGEIMNAIHVLGYGGIVLSGERCGDAALARALDVQEGERLAGFISAGTVMKAPPAAPPKALSGVWSRWEGEAAGG